MGDRGHRGAGNVPRHVSSPVMDGERPATMGLAPARLLLHGLGQELLPTVAGPPPGAARRTFPPSCAPRALRPVPSTGRPWPFAALKVKWPRECSVASPQGQGQAGWDLGTSRCRLRCTRTPC